MYIRECVYAGELSPNKMQYDHDISDSESAEDFAEDLVKLISRRRLSKDKALMTLKEATKSRKWPPDPSRTLRQNARELLMTLRGPDEAKRLVNEVASMLGYAHDPYLRELTGS